ncbi:uncharacterized protein LOC117611325 [Osmia lignaria lignaria]|uniref:uncharacterized protein LOC117611325 n=1 Tax=Osmia lignaria lignaria TaxID=1437193 RepID=UPI00402B16BA
MATDVSFADLLREQEELVGWIQRFWNNLCKLGKDKITRAVLEQRMGLFERYWEPFLTGHRTLMRCKEAAASSYAQRDVFSVVDETYLNTSAMIAQHLMERSPNNSSDGEQATPAPTLQPQLPKIELPTFSGDPLQWESFRDLFKSLVLDVTQLSDVKKLLYLKCSLTEDAAEVIQNTPITSTGFQEAWEDLELRYGNTHLLSFSHHRALLSCPPAKQQSVSELKRLLDTFRQTIRAYSSLKKPVSAWDEWFVFLLTQKLDKVTLLAWETSLTDSRDIPAFYQLSHFLENRIQALDAAQMTDQATHSVPNKDLKPKSKGNPAVKKTISTSLAASFRPAQTRKCPSCAGTHGLGYCAEIKALNSARRREHLKACFNCLNTGHESRKCPSSQRCLVCSGRHHTLLHDGTAAESSPTKMGEEIPPTLEPVSKIGPDSSSPTNALSLTVSSRAVALLATAKVTLEAPSGDTIEARALLDTGSDTSFVTSWVAQALRLPRRAVRVSVSGVQVQETGTATTEVELLVRPRRTTDFRLPIRALVLRRLTSVLPALQVVAQPWPHLHGIDLADPEFGVPSRVDLILGADVCGSLFLGGTRTGPTDTPVAKLTPFGWVLMGSASGDNPPPRATVRSFHCHTEQSTNQLLQRFWELEEVRDPAPLSAEEERCERHFQDTHRRDLTGRYRVRLPFNREPASTLKPSRSTAFKLLLSCERRLASNDFLGQRYADFMEEYSSLNHMQAVPEAEAQRPAYYLPHHAVVKRHDPSAKLRVVFNASCRTASGYSLNDCLSARPKLQANLLMILTRWRLFRVVFTTDIIKMFRQIQVHPADTDWQRILWRPHPGAAIQDYRLTTVTYRTACAPFLALRVLTQLPADEGHRFPLGAEAILRHSYVDDILAGADDLGKALELKRQVIAIFEAGGFRLSKWASNLPDLQEHPSSDPRLFQEPTGVSTLGVKWNPTDDTFSLRVAGPVDRTKKVTKRSILSEVASLFDLLGWTAPVLIFAKILMQHLWILGVDWDQKLPTMIRDSWCTFRSSLTQLDALSVPRWVSYPAGCKDGVELYGFCDASQRAYAAAVYLRVKTQGRTSIGLLVAKSKVVPVKTVSIPRLELCGALLLAKLLVQVKDGLCDRLDRLHCLVPLDTWACVSLEAICGPPCTQHRVPHLCGELEAHRFHEQSSRPGNAGYLSP